MDNQMQVKQNTDVVAAATAADTGVAVHYEWGVEDRAVVSRPQ